MKYLICLLAFASGAVLAHPGKLDAKGCHAKKGEAAHCHKSAAAASDSFSLSDPTPPKEVEDPNCIKGPWGARYKILNVKKQPGC
jgi:hypothetical protein